MNKPDDFRLSKRQRGILAFVQNNSPILTIEVLKRTYPKQEWFFKRQIQYVMRTLNILQDMGLTDNVNGLWSAK